jgi:SNF2 family DNA or RNA helicase
LQQQGSLSRHIQQTAHFFRIIRDQQDNGFDGPVYLRQFNSILRYFDDELHHHRRVSIGTGTRPALDHYITIMERSYNDQNKTLANVEKQEDELKHRIQTLTEAAAVAERDNGSAESEGNDAMAAKHGSKPAALVRHLQKLIKKGHQTIVFSYWHDTLKLIQATLKKCDIPSVFCDGRHTAEALSVFTSGNVKVILLSAQSKASGANLQCATHVALLDPAGQSAEHGSTLEEQAIGRAVRMGQENQVTVTRFCVVGTLEEKMFEQIDQAHTKALERASDDKYVIKDSSKVSTKEKANTQEENDATEVVVTAALTQEERL